MLTSMLKGTFNSARLVITYIITNISNIYITYIITNISVKAFRSQRDLFNSILHLDVCKTGDKTLYEFYFSVRGSYFEIRL